MFLPTAHPGIYRRMLLGAAITLGCIPALACGTISSHAKVESVTQRGEIRLDDGRLTRLAGLDGAALTAARSWIGESVGVALSAPRPDRWGRWLVDLTLPDGGSAAIEVLSLGLARVRPEFETRGCEVERLEAESAARAAGEGIWSDPRAILDASDLETLGADDGRFVLVEGIVRRVGLGRSRVYLDFGRRGGFTAFVARKAEAAFMRRGFALSLLAGQKVRLRGVLDDRFGPRIELADPSMIERADGSTETKPGG